MTTKEAIDYLLDPIGKRDQHDEAIKMAVDALQKQIPMPAQTKEIGVAQGKYEEPKKDECISRRAAINIVREECRKYTTMCIITMNRLEKLPTIHSKPIVGKWLDLRDGTATCSMCGRRTGHYDDDNADRYCSYCGAKITED